MLVIETSRLLLKPVCRADAVLMQSVLNDPDFIRYVGDRSIHTIEQAEKYIEQGSVKSFRDLGYGSFTVFRKIDELAIGTCSLIKRDIFDDADIGFAFLPQARGQGYALEAATATIEYVRKTLMLPRLLAITSTQNSASITLLEKLNFELQDKFTWPGEQQLSNLFLLELSLRRSA